MILHDRKNEDREQDPRGAVCGIKIDSIELFKGDVDKLLRLKPEQLKDWLIRLSMRYRPRPEPASAALQIKPFDWVNISELAKKRMKESEMNEQEFKNQFMCEPFVQRPLTDKQANKLGKRFNDTIERRREKGGPIVIIKSRLHEEDDPGFTFD